MRRLFCLIACVVQDENIGEIPRLCREHSRSTSDDFRRRGLGRRDSLATALADIDSCLRCVHRDLNCENLGIRVEYGEDDSSSTDDDVVILEDPAFTPVLASHRIQDNLHNLTVEQKSVFLRIVAAVCSTTGTPQPANLAESIGFEGDVDPTRGPLFFVDGTGGTGKTYLYNTLAAYETTTLGMPVACVAWTGIAAALLVGGKTVHKTFRLPLSLTGESTVGWAIEDEESEHLRRTDLILWDEAPVTHRPAVEAVDRYLMELSGRRPLTSSGKCRVFGRDFRQFLPVVPHGYRATIIDASLKTWTLWPELEQMRLKTNVRTRGLQGLRRMASRPRRRTPAERCV